MHIGFLSCKKMILSQLQPEGSQVNHRDESNYKDAAPARRERGRARI
jgi:hypothetical protein